jgi:hypothetical protein
MCIMLPTVLEMAFRMYTQVSTKYAFRTQQTWQALTYGLLLPAYCIEWIAPAPRPGTTAPCTRRRWRTPWRAS